LSRRLVLILLPLVLIPLIVMGGAAYLRSRSILYQQATDQLSSVASAQIEVLQEWITIREQRLQIGSQRSELLDPLGQILQDGPGNANARSEVRAQLDELKLREGTVAFVDVLLIDAQDGRVLVATDEAMEGVTITPAILAELTSMDLFSFPLYDDPLLSPDKLALISSAPVRLSGSTGIDAVLLGANSGVRLGALMQEMQVFWEKRGIYRVERGQTYLLLAPDISINLERYTTAPMVTAGVENPIFEQSVDSTSAIVEYVNTAGEPVLSAYEWFPEWDMGVVVELPQADIFTAIDALAPFSLVLILGATVITVFVILIVSNRILRPVRNLTDFAQRMARGEWLYRVPVDRDDEVGILASALNRMAEDLSGMYRSLEDRVEERTRQIRTAAEIARAVVSIPSLDDLLRRAVELIRDQFGYYHVSIFLLDESRQRAQLMESTGEVGQALKARGHSLEVGSQSIIGWVTENNQARIATDVSHDPFHFRNELLPETRSEAAVPLQLGGVVLGALDVQSTQSDAFTPEDLNVLQTLADQLSAAIQNTRLARSSAIAADRARLVSEVTRELSGLMDADEVLQTTARTLHQALGRADVQIKINAPEDGTPNYAERPTAGQAE
jgi:HAMP domain-containing protein